ncbi:MAG: hypothetical protein GY751_25390 [Bacteroidetes bacterium]|nr:hypothetical protein [Bacteroidota bacterium]
MKRTFPIAIGVQLVFICYGFFHLLSAPDKHVFADTFDGIKNYYTLASYVENTQESLLHYSHMNYPEGEHVTYTDNTPLFSIPFKLISNVFPQLGNHSVGVFNIFMVLGILFTTLVLVKLFHLYGMYGIVPLAASVCLPWLHPQIARYEVGHMNLAQSWILLTLMYLLIKFYRSGKQHRSVVMAAAVLLLSGFIHMYYLFIGGLLMGMMSCLVWLIGLIREKKSNWSDLMPAISAVVVMGIHVMFIQSTDPYIALREAALGYDYYEWKLHVGSLFTGNSYSVVPFFIRSSDVPPYEAFFYLGAFACYGLFFALLNRLWNKKFRLPALSNHTIALTITCFLLIFIALGNAMVLVYNNQLQLGFGSFSVDLPIHISIKNVLSPFYYLIKIAPDLSHFRCLTRFAWPTFWFVNLVVVILAYKWTQPGRSLSYRWVAYLLILIMGVDTAASMKHIHNRVYKNNPLKVQHFSNEIAQIREGIEWSDYDALLTSPFYHAGSAAFEYTILPFNDYYNTLTYQLALEGQLPLLNSKLSRTPLEFVKKKFQLFECLEASPIADSRKVLFAVHEEYLKQDTMLSPYESVNVFKSQEKQFIGLLNKPVLEVPDWKLYELSINMADMKLYCP